jgi:hypothetical protein
MSRRRFQGGDVIVTFAWTKPWLSNLKLNLLLRTSGTGETGPGKLNI